MILVTVELVSSRCIEEETNSKPRPIFEVLKFVISKSNFRSVLSTGFFCLAAVSASATIIQDFDNSTGSIAPGSTSLTYAGVPGSSTCANNTVLVPEGTYAIGNNANSCHSFWSTTGPQNPGLNNNFMIVNGNPIPGRDLVYQQVVTGLNVGDITVFSAWLTGLFSSNPAGIVLKVYDGNGTGGTVLTTSSQFNTNLSAPPTPAAWEQFATANFITLSDTITIQVINQSNVTTGNDFGLDTLEVNQGVPEPATFLIAGSALLGLAFRRRK